MAIADKHNCTRQSFNFREKAKTTKLDHFCSILSSCKWMRSLNCINQSINQSAWICYGAPHPKLWGARNTMKIQQHHSVTIMIQRIQLIPLQRGLCDSWATCIFLQLNEVSKLYTDNAPKSITSRKMLFYEPPHAKIDFVFYFSGMLLINGFYRKVIRYTRDVHFTIFPKR